jgi:hypothetical protein
VDFLLVAVLFMVLGLGLVLVAQGIIGKEIRSEWVVLGRPFDTRDPGPTHPPDRHPRRSVLIGLVLIAGSIGLAALLL